IVMLGVDRVAQVNRFFLALRIKFKDIKTPEALFSIGRKVQNVVVHNARKAFLARRIDRWAKVLGLAILVAIHGNFPDVRIAVTSWHIGRKEKGLAIGTQTWVGNGIGFIVQ